ncbi:hypothetical protein HW555_002915 [Spodoptera exigua]|uniref:Uncharacterized protein n=1 Tax=Spodoptera exigua TaxID=7107 RepID=A0A835L6L2_SPOEX|nr:hypothetical protein HW555_002915 [Spodoptera exigua]
MMDVLRNAYNNKKALDFENIDSISPEELYLRTGLTHEQFAIVLNDTPSLNQHTRQPKTVLACYLMKIRSAEPDVRIACHLKGQQDNSGTLPKYSPRVINERICGTSSRIRPHRPR